MKLFVKKYYLVLLLVLLFSAIKAQETENIFQSRTSITLSTKPFKKLKLSVGPEFRFDENFSLSKYLLEGKASYQITHFLRLGTGYRFYGNNRETKSTEYYTRYAFSASLKKSYYRFDPSLKISYTNFSDDDSNSNLLRYKASISYNIRKSKITPYAGAEGFQQLSSNDLYKMRYFIGLDYKLCKKNYLAFSYKFDYFMNEYKNKHILSIGYKLKI